LVGCEKEYDTTAGLFARNKTVVSGERLRDIAERGGDISIYDGRLQILIAGGLITRR